MKKFGYILFSLVSMTICSCSTFDDSSIQQQLKDHESRIQKLEQLCKDFQQNLGSVQEAVAALQKSDYVTGVSPILYGQETIGYTITFKNSSPISIYHGKDAANPVIGIKQDTDGQWYWTLDGEWMSDQSGHKIKAVGIDGASGITPQMKIEDDYWYVSTDNGAIWTKLGKATGEDGDSFFKSVENLDAEVILTLSDGTKISLPKYQPLNIEFTYEKGTPIIGEEKIPYEIKGKNQEYEIEAFTTSSRWAVEVEKTDNTHGNLLITHNTQNDDSKIIVFVTASDGESTTRILTLETGKVVCDNSYMEIDEKAQTVTFNFQTNLPEYEFFIPEEAASWISLIPDTKVMTDASVSFSIKANDTDYDRGVNIFIIRNEIPVSSISISQKAIPVAKLYLTFESSSDTKASLNTDMPSVGDEVLVNNTKVKVSEIIGNAAIVKVEPAYSFRISWPAENMGYNENCEYVVKTFPAVVSSDVNVQYYAARTDYYGNILSGDVSVNMKKCTAVLGFDASSYPTASYAIMTGGNSDDCLSGTVEYVWNLQDLYLVPGLVEFYGFKNKSNSVKIEGIGTDGIFYVQLLPQTLSSGFSISIYDAGGNSLVTRTNSTSRTLTRGYMLKFPAL